MQNYFNHQFLKQAVNQFYRKMVKIQKKIFTRNTLMTAKVKFSCQKNRPQKLL